MTVSRTAPRRRPLSIVLAAVSGPLLAAPAAHAAASDDIRINEVVTTGSVNDSIELYNKGTASVDVSGWILTDDNNSSKYKIASGTVPAAGGFKASRP